MNRFLNRRAVSGLMLILLTISMSSFMFGTRLTGTAQSGAGGSWLCGWSYRKAHNITGSSAGEQSNYPVLMSVHYGQGADSQGDVYLNGKCRSDFGDVRFTDSSGGSLLDYYIEQEADGAIALFWVNIDSILRSPSQTQIYVYYGNLSASTTSNKDWTFDSASDFEDGTNQGWIFSPTSYVLSDGVSNNAFEGNFSRSASRDYGLGGNAGTGHFYERFSKQTVYLSTGSYHMECATAFDTSDQYRVPFGVRLMVNEVAIDEVSSPGTTWHLLAGNFTLSSSALVTLNVEFHLWVSGLLRTGAESYFLDSVVVRRWCDPEPSNGAWGGEEVIPQTIIVPDNYTTIQGAINAASTGGTVYVRKGTYHENVVVNKTLLLLGENPQNTIIVGGGVGSVLTIATEYADVAGFTLRSRGSSMSNAGITLDRANYCNITGNNITNNGNGIWLSASSNNSISGNNITTNDFYGVLFDYSSSSDSVNGNSITANNWWGIGLDSSGNNISGNAFTNDGLYVWDSYQNSVESNTVNGRPLVYLEGVSNYTVADAGQIVLVNCENIRVQGLNLSRTGSGIELWGTSNSTISGNNITANNLYGIDVEYSSNYNSVSGNNITNNYNGIDLEYSLGNRIFHNNFLNNSIQASSSGSPNTWDDGYPGGGNYWSDYQGTDFCHGIGQNVFGSDGIGDTPYVINAQNQDNYPLMTAGGSLTMGSSAGGGRPAYVC